MRWPPWKRNPDKEGRGMRHKVAPPSEVIDFPKLADQAAEAHRALSRADAALHDALGATEEVDRVSNALRRTRKRNSFGEMMLESFRRHA